LRCSRHQEYVILNGFAILENQHRFGSAGFMRICGRCRAIYSEHAVYRVKLDDINYDSDSYLKENLQHNYGICNVRFDYFNGFLIITYNPLIVSQDRIDKILITPGYIIEDSYLRFLVNFFKAHAKVLRFSTVLVMLIFGWFIFFRFGANRFCLPFNCHNVKLINMYYIIINIAILFLCSFPIYDGIKQAFKYKRFNVYLLALLAVSGAALSGFLFEASNFLLVLLFVELLEDFIKCRSSKEVAAAAVAGAKNAFVIIDGTSRKIPVHDLIPGQLIDVKQGMIVPVDGVVISGDGQINEAAISGENSFNSKSNGDKVYAGTLLETGSLIVKAVSVGHDTAVGNIAKLIEGAANSDARQGIQKTVDRYSVYLTIIVIAFSIVAFFVSFSVLGMGLFESIERSVAILFVACPCALILSTPTAIHAGIWIAARNGILFKDGGVMEYFAKTTALLVDKTGTLTHASPVVAGVKTFGDTELDDILFVATTVERNSFHPLALAVCEYALQRNIQFGDAQKYIELEGGGACAVIDGKKYKVGARWLMDDGREITPEINNWIQEAAEKGLVTALVADEAKILGAFTFTDKLREEAPEVVRKLRLLGMNKIIMITGDNCAAAERIAGSLHLDGCFAECMPEMKLQKLHELKKTEKYVAMIGDGINDAPVLAASDVGIAIAGTGADAAIAAADIALTGEGLDELSKSYSISKRVFLTIRVNLFFSLLASLAMMFLVSAGIFSLMTGTLIYAVCSVLVVINSYLPAVVPVKKF
jgi:heavy metal translocating P-type ATPase